LTKLRACLKRTDIKQDVLDDIEDAVRKGVQGTPTYFVNNKSPRIPLTIDSWIQQIESMLGPRTASSGGR
jgi:protein-disulfide isomerase